MQRCKDALSARLRTGWALRLNSMARRHWFWFALVGSIGRLPKQTRRTMHFVKSVLGLVLLVVHAVYRVHMKAFGSVAAWLGANHLIEFGHPESGFPITYPSGSLFYRADCLS